MLKKILLSLVTFVVVIALGLLTFLFLARPKMRPAPVLNAEATPERLARGEYLGQGCLDCHSKRDFKKSLAENFEMTMAVMRGLVRRLRDADRKIGSLALLDVYGRVARLLLDMSETVNGQKMVTKRLPKQDIAKMIGASREMVSRVMKDLQMGGYIEMRGSAILLRDSIMLPE